MGAELVAPSEASVRVWAPDQRALDVVVDGRATALTREDEGYFSAHVAARSGSRYGFRLAGDRRLLPDPASRWQPDGPEALSAITDLSYEWRDASWGGVTLPGQVVYEMHIGTFTPAGTWRAAEQWFSRLRDLGVTIIQMMPIAEFAGAFGWGYDGVLWFAPQHTYGSPRDLQHFVDTAHRHGLGVILDVVYNHVGPAGNVLPRFSTRYFTDRHFNEWGDAINFDDQHAGQMRALVQANAEYWIRDFHFDGFRLDAVQQIHDRFEDHIVSAVARTARAAAAPRQVILLAEHEPQHARFLRPPGAGGCGLDGLFNEDFHHSTRVALTGVREAYLSDYSGESREWLSALQCGFLFQGQYYPWQEGTRGAPALDLPPYHFVNFLENHDQVANSAAGRRLIDLTSPSWWRAMSAFLLLGPWTPLLFQGQEWGSRQPFQYFADHSGDLQDAVGKGRREFLSQFPRRESDDLPARLTDLIGAQAFERSRLDHAFDAEAHPLWRLYRDLLALRRGDPSLGQHAARIIGAALTDRTLLLRYLGASGAPDRLLVVNLGADLNLGPVSAPLAAPPLDHVWAPLWCSEEPRYGGGGVAACEPPAMVMATGHATTVFQPRAIS